MAAVRARCGEGFAILVRLDGREYGHGDDGITPDLAAENAAVAEAAGADAVHVSASTVSPLGVGFTDGPLPWKHGQYVELARTVKRRVGIPVVAVGRIEPALAESLLAEGTVCDFVSMGRQLLADPPYRIGWRPGDRTWCAPASAVSCAWPRTSGTPPRYAPSTPASATTTSCPATAGPNAAEVVVVGGGLAGMEAARWLPARATASCCSSGTSWGATARLSALTTPANAESGALLAAAVAEAGVDVRLGILAGVEEIVGTEQAARCRPRRHRRPAGRPEVPGGELPHVLSGDDLRAVLTGSGLSGSGSGARMPLRHRMVLAAGRRAGILDDVARMRQLSKRWLPLGRRVVVIGGGLVGLELSEFLAERGRQVTLLEDSGYIGEEMALPRRFRAIHEAANHGVTMVRLATVIGISAREVSYEVDGQVQGVRADHVVYAAGVKPDPRLADELIGAGLNVRRIGDCAQVGYIQGAIHSAAAAIADL